MGNTDGNSVEWNEPSTEKQTLHSLCQRKKVKTNLKITENRSGYYRLGKVGTWKAG